MRVLVVEDFVSLRESLVQGLTEAGYAVDATGDGEEGLWFAEQGVHDVIVLDLMLPGMDGMSILERLRARKSTSRVLILTARDSIEDRVHGLESGADDYLVKPFAFAEFLARIQALVRRGYESAGPRIIVADLTVDTRTRSAHRREQLIELTAREYLLLEYLALRHGHTVTRDEIWQHLYDYNAEPNSNVIDVHVARLRHKLEADGQTRLLHTRRGLGYVLGAPS